jgi:hypothetical protein
VARYQVLRERTLSLYPALMDVARRRDASTTGSRLAASAAQLGTDTLMVVICGEFKRGKSSLLNALLEEVPPLFPVDARVATSAVTVVSWAPTVQVLLSGVGSDGAVEERAIDRSAIAGYVTESGRAPDGVRVTTVRVGIPHPMLASGLVVVDTPGVGGVFSAHTAATMAFLPSADAIVFVSDFTQPLLKTELEFLRLAASANRTIGDEDSLVFVMTKSDVIGAEQRDELLHNTAVKIAEVTGCRIESVTVIPVSSLAKSDYLSDGDPQDLADSNFVQFERVLWSTVTRRRARVNLGTALTELESATRALLRPLDDELSALEEGTHQKLAELGRESETRRAELDRLRDARAEWRDQLRDDMDDAGRWLQREAERLLADVWHRADTVYLATTAHLDDSSTLAAKLTSDLSLMTGTLGELAQRRAARALQDFTARNGLQLRHPRIDALPPPAVPPITLPPRRQTTGLSWERARKFAESSTIGRDVGGLIGAIVSLCLGAGQGVGGFLGNALGGLFDGVVRATALSERRAESVRGAQREYIWVELRRLRARHQLDLQRSIDDLVSVLVRSVTAELDGRIERERETVHESLYRLAGARDRTEQESRRRRQEIEVERGLLLRTHEEIDRIAGEAVRLGDRDG